jgi:hypothetical protein
VTRGPIAPLKQVTIPHSGERSDRDRRVRDRGWEAAYDRRGDQYKRRLTTPLRPGVVVNKVNAIEIVDE